MSSCRSMFPGVRSSLVFSSFGFNSPAFGFQSYFTVASRLLHPYSSTDKTSRLMVKILHSEGHPERFTELHEEEKREKGDRGDQEEKRGNQKGESNLASNQFPMCSPQSGTLREFHGVT